MSQVLSPILLRNGHASRVAWSFDEALQLEQEDGSTVLKHGDCEYKYHCHFFKKIQRQSYS